MPSAVPPTALCCALLLALGTPAAAQMPPRVVEMDSARAAALYVSNRPEDHPPANYEAALRAKAVTDSIYAARSRGLVDFRKVTYTSSVGDMEIPAYLFQPLEPAAARTRAALVWVHGGVHGNWDQNYWPFVRAAVERGYVVITPEYRGSTGFGAAHHNAIDYGGFEVEDVMTAHAFLRDSVPSVDPARVAIMGWSHGGYIALLSVFREQHPFAAAAAIVPVTNLIFRLAYKGPSYQRSFATQQRIGGLPHEKREIYVERSPYYHVHRLGVPLLVHVATNDMDVNFEESSMLIWSLRAQKPDLAETVIYTDPTPGPSSGGHTFSRRVNRQTLELDDSPEQIDSWNRTWDFLQRHLGATSR
jgi:dipeptidyl aminopeptidase/acylaminoacyl peptidase